MSSGSCFTAVVGCRGWPGLLAAGRRITGPGWAAGNRTRRKNRSELGKYQIPVRETTRNYAKRPANTRKVLMASALRKRIDLRLAAGSAVGYVLRLADSARLSRRYAW